MSELERRLLTVEGILDEFWDARLARAEYFRGVTDLVQFLRTGQRPVFEGLYLKSDRVWEAIQGEDRDSINS